MYVDPSLPYYDGFEDYISFANNDAWQSVSIGVGPASFGLTTIAALSGEKSARLQNCGQPEGAIDELIAGPIDLSVLNFVLFFWWTVFAFFIGIAVSFVFIPISSK